MKIRHARSEDAREIAEVWLRSRAASTPAIPPAVHADEEVRTWFADVVLPTMEVWVAEVDGSAVAALVLDGDRIDQLYVAPGHTGQGLGTELLNVAKARRPKGLRLWTFQANQRARRFYETHGFRATQTTDGDNEEGAPDVLYEWNSPAS